MKKKITLLLFSLSITLFSQQTVQDDFEGNGTITTWTPDAIKMNKAFSNPFKVGINTSNTVLRYEDYGGQYANVNFDVATNFDLSENHTFTFKIYVPTSSITGMQTNQVSLKLQDGSLGQPWTTQTEIIKPIILDTWQTVSFNFKDDAFINLNAGSALPINRKDFNRVLIQVNGENNTDKVTAYIDDFLYDGVLPETNDDSTDDANFDMLVWSDEFDGNGAIDNSKWFHQIQLPSGGNWYNNERQHYTNRLENSYLEGGMLHIVAKKESFTDQGHTKDYTSARLNSKFAFTYGKVQVRAKLPTGFGTWPAIWMLGKNINEPGGYWTSKPGDKVGWPACGEIDIMEHWGKNQNYISSAMHTPSSHGGTINHGGQTIPTASTAFHVYELIWTPEKMVFSVDGNVHYTYNPATKNEDTWPFDADQYFLLNIAIEGSGTDNSFTESAMDIDYIRVYQASPSLGLDDKISTEKELKVYPNPSNNMLTIKTNIDFTQAIMFDVTGKKIHTIYKKDSNNTYDISFLKKGLYFLKINSSQVSKTVKIIKI